MTLLAAAAAERFMGIMLEQPRPGGYVRLMTGGTPVYTLYRLAVGLKQFIRIC